MLLSMVLSKAGLIVEDINTFLEVLMVGATIPDLGVALSLENMPIACFPHKSDVLTLLLLMNKMIAAQQTSNFCHLNLVVMLHM